MLTRRSTTILLLAGVFTAAIFIGLVHAQQPSPPQQAQQSQQPATAPPPAANVPPQPAANVPAQATAPAPPPEIRVEEIEANLANLTSCRDRDRLALEPHCEAVKALLEFIRGLGLAGTSSPFPSCDPALIPQIDPMNLKVTAAIDFHKYSDTILDENRRDAQHQLQKSKLTAANDEAIRHIVRILQQYFYGHNPYGSDYAPLIHYAELARLAERVLDHNFELARQWGLDAGFLTGARGYVIYQYVFNCIRTRDFRLAAEQMAARAYAVRLAAFSQSYFSRQVEKNLSNPSQHSAEYLAWEVQKDIIERRFPTYPTKIFLGSNVRIPGFGEPSSCDTDKPITNFYGFLTKKTMQLIEGRAEFTYTEYAPASPKDIEDNGCQTTINSGQSEAVNGLMIPGLVSLPPTGGKDMQDWHDLVMKISNAINRYERYWTANAWLTECTLNPTPRLAEACEALKQWIIIKNEFPSLQQAVAQQGYSNVDVNQITREFAFLEKLSGYVRDSLSPPMTPLTSFEELRDRR